MIDRRAPTVAAAAQALRSGQWPERPGSAYEAELGAWIRDRVHPRDTVFVHGMGTSLAILWSAHRRSGSRYLESAAVNTPARLEAQLAELRRTQPAVIVVVGGDGERPITPFLRERYTLLEERHGPYRVEIWGSADTTRRAWMRRRPVVDGQ